MKGFLTKVRTEEKGVWSLPERRGEYLNEEYSDSFTFVNFLLKPSEVDVLDARKDVEMKTTNLLFRNKDGSRPKGGRTT